LKARRIAIVGGGAAGFFAALACVEAGCPDEILILEKGPQFLSKVKISGGGRCNVTHALFDEREFATRYPRGEHSLIGPFTRFQARDTVAWFAAHGVALKTEADGRMFPITDSSQTIIDCLLTAARHAGIKLYLNAAVQRIQRGTTGFEVVMGKQLHPLDQPNTPSAEPESGTTISSDRVLLATGGCRTPEMAQLAISLGHTLEPPVPSLFTFHIQVPWLRELAGISLEAKASVADTELVETGACLITHWGLSGPAILRLSAWGARWLHEKNYRFSLHINWLPRWNAEKLAAEFQSRRTSQAARLVINSPVQSLPARLWEKLVIAAGIGADTRWSTLSRSEAHKLSQQLGRTEFPVTGKSLNKDEFVTCGGIRLGEVNFKSMESRICPGLFFAGELLDIDGITGGFNFQAAWTTGWIAGQAMAKKSQHPDDESAEKRG
jgi:predicted Rossmann fold flavoprotein